MLERSLLRSRVLQRTLQRLEPDEGKLSRPVLRGEGGGNTADPPDYMIERATQVFGLRGLGWKLEYSPENMVFIGLGEGKRITAHLKYAVFSYALVNERGEIQWYPIITGAANTNDFTYAEEGARTAAIGAALKSLCFQLPVYKGQLDHHNAGKLLGNGTLPGSGIQPGGNGNGAKLSGIDVAKQRDGHSGTTSRPGNGNGNGAQRTPDEILNELGYNTQTQPGAAPHAQLVDDPGAHVIRHGKSYAGWTLRKMVEENPKGREAGLTALRWYANELKPATDITHADQAAAKKFLALIETQLQPA